MTDFVKLHGLGNDFVVMDRRSIGSPVTPAEGIALCDRHRGIGADGVLSVLPSKVAPLAMHVTNSDGSLAEMCGNGLRCVVRYAVDRDLLPKTGGKIETGRGVLECFVEPDGQVRVDMGAPVLEPERVPVKLPGARVVDVAVSSIGEAFRMTAVSMGNPHAVMFIDDDRPLTSLATTFGPSVEHHALFPRRTNAEFARLVEPDLIELVVWERGAGLTQACGTGACATVVAAALTNRIPAGKLVRVRLPGGELRIRLEPDFSRVWMTGPAVEVFSGATT